MKMKYDWLNLLPNVLKVNKPCFFLFYESIIDFRFLGIPSLYAKGGRFDANNLSENTKKGMLSLNAGAMFDNFNSILILVCFYSASSHFFASPFSVLW